MNRFIPKVFIVCFFLLLGPIGCQGMFQHVSHGELAMKDGEFIDLWDTYNLCMSGQNIWEIQEHLNQLYAAPKPMSLDDAPIPIPKFIKNLTSARSSRLAVDPRAMAASCSIHLADVALDAQDMETAFNVLKSMSREFHEPQYAYYVSKAELSLKQFATMAQPVSLSFRDALIQ